LKLTIRPPKPDGCTFPKVGLYRLGKTRHRSRRTRHALQKAPNAITATPTRLFEIREITIATRAAGRQRAAGDRQQQTNPRMSNTTFDTIVLGVGAMGSAACFHLAQRGMRVLGLEQFSIPHSRGSHHGDSRMIRLCYYEHTDYVPLLRRAYQLWQELENHSGQRLLHMTGGIYMGDPNSEFIAGTLRAAKHHQLDHDQLSRDDLRKRFPQFHVPDSYIGVWEPNAGFLLPEKVVAAHASLALRHGAELHGHEPALEWSADDRSHREEHLQCKAPHYLWRRVERAGH
jgi:hypothetical protein